MTQPPRRFGSLQFRFGAMLTALLLVFLMLCVCNLILNRKFFHQVGTIQQTVLALGLHDTQDNRLNDLRVEIGNVTRQAERGLPVPEARWRGLERAIGQRRAIAPLDDAALPDHGGALLIAERAAEARFAGVASAMIAAARRDAGTVKANMPGFVAGLRQLEQRREAVHQMLVGEIKTRGAEAEALGRRDVAQTRLCALLAFLVVAALILWLRMRILWPVIEIVAAVRAMTGGAALPPLASSRRVDELGDLARGLDALSQAVAERGRIQAQVEYLAHHDPLTGLANRLVFSDRLSETLNAGHRIALVAIDLDGFKGVNDTLGHATGDMLLKRASAMLTAAAREGDLVARIGGDEFAIVHRLRPDEEDAGALIERLFAIIAADPASPPAPAIRLSIGVALSQRHSVEGDELHACADIALYRAKADGRHRARHYDKLMDEERRQRRWLAHELRDAGVRGELGLAFQPIADCATRRIIGQEALARWHHPVLGEIRPDIFIAIAEENGLIGEIGQQLLADALSIAAGWPTAWMLAINLSPVQLREPDLAERMLASMAAHRMAPDRIEVEVTEGVLIDRRETATANLARLRAAGVRIVMDDFGTGYSSLSSLQQFPFDKIKIDRSFIHGMGQSGPALSIVRASLGLGHSLNIPIVAEGVETEQQWQTLCEMGCDQIQGYLIGRPVAHRAEAA
jgi:diguanylate cyclase (GGDEF)-like protein